MIKKFYFKLKDRIFKISKKWDALSIEEENAISFAVLHINPEPNKYLLGSNSEYTPEWIIAHFNECTNRYPREDQQDDSCDMITKRISENTADVPLILYRGVGDYIYNNMKDNARGTEFDYYEKGFMSTSLVKGHEYRYKKRLRIFVPVGSHVIYLGNVNDEQFNYEVVIQRGAKLKIRSIDQEYINCELLETY